MSINSVKLDTLARQGFRSEWSRPRFDLQEQIGSGCQENLIPTFKTNRIRGPDTTVKKKPDRDSTLSPLTFFFYSKDDIVYYPE